MLTFVNGILASVFRFRGVERSGSNLGTSDALGGIDMPEQDYNIDTEQEYEDGRWIAEVRDLPGVMAYGSSREEAIANAEAIAFRVIADRIEESKVGTSRVSFASA